MGMSEEAALQMRKQCARVRALTHNTSNISLGIDGERLCDNAFRT